MDRRQRLYWIGLLIFFTLLLPLGTEEGEAAVRHNPRFRWLAPAPAVYPGGRLELLLELTDWESGREAPQGFFQGNVPAGIILQESSVQAFRAGIFRYRINVIMLEEDNVVLEAFSFESGNYVLNVPALTIPVRPRPPAFSPADREAGAESSNGAGTPHDIPVQPFPQSRESVFFLVQGEYDRIIADVRALWEENRRSEALAEIRRNERDSLSGPFLLPLRREMELEMGLGFSENEKWRPLRIQLVSYIIFVIAILSVLMFLLGLRPRSDTIPKLQNSPLRDFIRNFVLKLRVVRFFRENAFIRVIVLLLAVGLALIILEESLGTFPGPASSENAVIFRTTQAYRIPDLKGAVNDWFMEGQPVLVDEHRGEWSLAETPDGRSGWVRREQLIIY